jgi:tetratricopeptide (TPR) repeat protein
MEHPEAFHKGCIQIYILTFSAYLDIDSLLDYAEHEYVLVFHHEADILRRLLIDIASYYIKIGKTSLNQGMLADTHQALTYFQWARTLLLRACKTARSAQSLIDQAEKMINDEIISSEDDKYVRDDWKKNLNNSIFIYHSQEYRQEAIQLSSILNTLTNEQGVLFEDYMMFIAKFQKENCTIKHGCPIIIASNNINQTKIFTELSSLANIDQIYVLSPLKYMSSTGNDQTLLEQFSKVRNIYSQAKILALEWTAERSSLCDKIGDLCSGNDDHDLARAYYTKAIELNQNLSAFIKKK